MYQTSKKAYAKINLHLDVVSKYDNGYHEVNTVMQSVSLADDVFVSLEGDGISLICDKDGIPDDNRNIAWRAAERYFAEYGKLSCGVKIKIEKRIPSEAGLGGGSADAAAVLCALNELFDFPLDRKLMLELGASIGADVPFCMIGGTAYADGTGTDIEMLPDMPHCHIVIARGGEGISTPWAYGELDRRFCNFERDVFSPRGSYLIRSSIENGSIADIGNSLYNIFEDVIVPVRSTVARIKQTLLECGACGALMSGSGTAVYGLFDDIRAANLASDILTSHGFFTCVVRPVSKFGI